LGQGKEFDLHWRPDAEKTMMKAEPKGGEHNAFSPFAYWLVSRIFHPF
jgi:hypothetical protein